MNPPLHARITDALRQDIRSGRLGVGAAVPSEARLQERFGASRGTVRTALAALQREGLIERGQGRPTTVRGDVESQPFETFMSFTSWARQIGREPGQRTLEVARRGASDAAAAALGIAPGSPVVDVLRLRTLDGRPAMIERSSFVEPVGRLLFDFDPDTGSVYQHLREQGIPLHSARHVIDAVGADATDAEALEVNLGAPLLRERRRALSPQGEPFEFGEDRYRPDRVTFSIDNVQPAASGAVPDLRILKEIS